MYYNILNHDYFTLQANSLSDKSTQPGTIKCSMKNGPNNEFIMKVVGNSLPLKMNQFKLLSL